MTECAPQPLAANDAHQNGTMGSLPAGELTSTCAGDRKMNARVQCALGFKSLRGLPIVAIATALKPIIAIKRIRRTS